MASRPRTTVKTYSRRNRVYGREGGHYNAQIGPSNGSPLPQPTGGRYNANIDSSNDPPPSLLSLVVLLPPRHRTREHKTVSGTVW